MKPVRARYGRIEQVVSNLLAENQIVRAPVPVEEIADNCGAYVQFHEFNNEISGMLLRANDQLIIGVEKSQSSVRKRFTIAHELGHLLLHAGQEVRVDTDFRINFRDSTSSTAADVEEIEANAFAASLLMPQSFLQQDLRDRFVDVEDEELIKQLAKKYNVSIQAMTIRIATLMNLHRL